MYTTRPIAAKGSEEPIESRLIRFAAAWEANDEPDISSFIPAEATASIIVEFVIIDMEKRFQAGQSTTIERYIASYPQLANDTESLAQLIENESRFRQQFGSPPEPGEYARRFPNVKTSRSAGFAQRAMALLDPPDGTGGIGRLGKYRILRVIGRGGMGVVFEAEDPALKRIVALKLVRPEFSIKDADGARVIAGLRAEAEAVAAVRHANVVQVYEVSEHAGRPFLALEYCPNGTLSERFKLENRLSPASAAELLLKISRGVQAAHAQEIIHRDLKPANVLFDEHGEPKVTDFGLAKRGARVQLQTHSELGTPAYLSPEQARGDRAFVGTATDVWALGVILYEALAGRRPHESDGVWGLLGRIANQPPTPLRSHTKGISRDLEFICHKCLAADPQSRYPNAGALADDLERFLTGKTVAARPVNAWISLARWGQRNPAVASLLAMLVVVLLGASIGMGILWNQAVQDRSVAINSTAEANIQRMIADTKAEEAKIQEAIAVANQTKAEKSKKQSDESFAYLRNLFLSSDVFGFRGTGFINTTLAPKDFTVRQLLDRGTQHLASISDPIVRTKLEHTLGYVYWSIGDFAVASKMLNESLEQNRRLNGDEHEETITNLQSLSALKWFQGNFDSATELNRKSVEMSRRIFMPSDPRLADALFSLSWALVWQLDGSDRNFKEGMQLLSEAEQIYRLANRKRDLIRVLLTQMTIKQSQTIDASELLKISQEVQALGNSPTEDIFAKVMSTYIQATSHRRNKRWEDSKEAYLKTLEELGQIVTSNHPVYILTLMDFAGLLQLKEENQEAKKYMLAAHYWYKNSALYGHPRVAALYPKATNFLRELGEYDEAYRIGTEGIAFALKQGKIDQAKEIATPLTEMLRGLGRFVEAEAINQALEKAMQNKDSK